MLKYFHLNLPAGRNVSIGLKALVAAGFTALLVWQLRVKLSALPLEFGVYQTLTRADIGLLAAALGLSFVNWGLEAFKWQRLASTLQQVRFADALRGTLYGVGVGFVTPHRLGEWIGKVSVFDPPRRVRGVPLSLVSGCTQMLMTLVTGCVAVLALGSIMPGTALFHQAALATGAAAAAALGWFVFVRRGRLPRVWPLTRFERLAPFLNSNNICRRALVETMLLSAARYTVFTMQFLLLLAAFDAALPFAQGIAAVAVVFFFLTWLPVPVAAEPALRGNVALFFLIPLVPHPVGIVCAATALWIVNLLLPALAGASWFLTDKRV